MIRRFDDRPRAGIRYHRRPGVYALIRRGQAVLLTFQATPLPEFQLPGGGVDASEQPLAALHREVREETGWTIAVERRLGAFRRFAYLPEYDLWAEKLCTVYLARPIRALGPPSEPGHAAVWMPLAVAARQLGNPGDRHFAATLR
jgi:8-oxo-dGTP diphosphatase